MLNQKLKLKLSQKLSPQQIQLMKLIQLSTLEFEEKIKNEIEENPALERGVEELEDHNKENEENSTEDKFEENEIDVDSYLSEDDFPSYDLGYYNSDESTNKEIPTSCVCWRGTEFAESVGRCCQREGIPFARW